MIRIFQHFSLMILVATATGCQTADYLSSEVLKNVFKDKPTIIEATYEVSKDVNPDRNGRASPINVRFYILKSPDIFENTDFFVLREQDRELLATELKLLQEKFPKVPIINILFRIG